MAGRQAQKGGSRIGTVIALLVVGYGVLVLMKWGPLRIDQYEFDQGVLEILKFKNTFRPVPDEEGVREMILEKAKEIGVPIEIDQIRVWTADGRMHAQIHYSRPLELPGIKKTLEYDVEQSWVD